MGYYSMDFYLNENNLISDKENIISNLKEIKEFYDLLKLKNYKLYIKDNLDLNYKELCNSSEKSSALLFLKNLEHIKTYGINWLEQHQIEPIIKDNCYFIELMSLCHRYSNNLIVSSTREKEVIHSKYKINDGEIIKTIENVIGKNKLREYLIANPAPQSITEVFEKVEKEFPHIKFTDKAYKTAVSRENIYKQFGFLRLLNIFEVIETLIYPFLKQELEGFTEDSIKKEFKDKTNGIEFSQESDTTMNKYGKQRDVTINGTKIRMSYHIKPSDNRIYFTYDKKDDCIYIGHSGKHLDIVSVK